MKCKERGFDMNTELGAGWAYFVDHRDFEHELARVKGVKQPEASQDLLLV